MNWNDPAERFRLAERVGHDEYNRLQVKHIADSSVATVNGHGIRPISSRFGRLFMVGATGKAFSTLEQAKAYAEANLS